MNSLGLLETRTIAGGVGLIDLMVKEAEVMILRAGTICSGRFMIQVKGEEEAVATAMAVRGDKHRTPVISYHLTGVAPQVFAVLSGQKGRTSGTALGVLETKRAVSGIAAADAAVKHANVAISRLSLAQGINGKAWLVVGGEVAAVEEAVAAAKDAVTMDLLDSLVLPCPDEMVLAALIPGGSSGHGKDLF